MTQPPYGQGPGQGWPPPPGPGGPTPPAQPGYGPGPGTPPGYGQVPLGAPPPGYGQAPPGYGQVPPASPGYGPVPGAPPGYGQGAPGYGPAPGAPPVYGMPNQPPGAYGYGGPGGPAGAMMPYGGGAAVGPGGYSDKSLGTATILSYFGGIAGIDRFYVGHVGLGIAKLLTCGGLGIWAVIDLVLFCLGKVTDNEGRRLQPPGDVVGTPTIDGPQTLLLSLFGGSFGVDRFMLGHTGLGIAKLLTFGGCGIWHLVDFLLIASGSMRDAQGNSLKWE